MGAYPEKNGSLENNEFGVRVPGYSLQVLASCGLYAAIPRAIIVLVREPCR